MGSLTLGWVVTREGHPRYWLEKGARPGLQKDEDLVRVPAKEMATHTAIVAQSGSGKSFFLGRLIEELLLETKARCLILDPNADFRRVFKVENRKLWNDASYDMMTRSGKLPNESTQDEFNRKWSLVGKEILTGDDGESDKPPFKRLQVFWPTISIDFLTEGTSALQRIELNFCHAFVGTVARLIQTSIRLEQLIKRQVGKPRDLFDTAASLFRDRQHKNDKEFEASLVDQFVIESKKSTKERRESLIDRFNRIQLRRIARTIEHLKYFREMMWRYYLGTARQYEADGIVATERTFRSPDSFPDRKRLVVIDLPSLEKQSRFLAISATLGEVWGNAKQDWDDALDEPPDDDKRVPTFIVVDEAHNLLPADTTDPRIASIRDQFRSIAAEGRKYGLFLILVSQRPDKLDSIVLSECENKALMHFDSSALLNIVKKRLGLEDLQQTLLEQCLQPGRGRVLLTGRWAHGEERVMYTAARRTVEGGRNLRSEYWAEPQT